MIAAEWSMTSAPARPQTGSSLKIGAIHVHGMKTFSEAQIVAATGLKQGQTFDPKNLDAVAERLGKSGAFSDISYSYVPKNGQMAIDFKVEEGKFRACHFDNFVWLSDAEIAAGLSKELPLYNGMLPETGEMLDEISPILEKLSQEKGITVRVHRMVEQGGVGDPNWSHLYVADGVHVTVQSLRFVGNQAVSEGDLQKVAAQLVGRDYSAFQAGLFGSKAIVPYYNNLGYLAAKAETQSSRILSHTEGSNDYLMEVTFAVTEGDLFRWAGVEWSGSQGVQASALDAATGMKMNEIALGERIEAGWLAARTEYSKSGYLDLRLDPRPVLDMQARLVHYQVRVTEGAQYHMRNFIVTGTTPEAAAKIEERWKLKPGDVYNAAYAQEFIPQELIPLLKSGKVRAARIGLNVVPNRDLKVVDVKLNLT